LGLVLDLKGSGLGLGLSGSDFDSILCIDTHTHTRKKTNQIHSVLLPLHPHEREVCCA